MPLVEQNSAVPALTAVVPARNAAATLPRCLDALVAQACEAPIPIEIVVVDDFSDDETAAIAARYPVRLIGLGRHLGAAAARNRGAEVARAPLLLFLDADVVLAPGALVRAFAAFANPAVGALIGSYDDDPAEPSTVSRFKNLAHHYLHPRSGPRATTFWSGCGLVRREVFVNAGGFDDDRFALEDVELGYRMAAQGVRIDLDPGLQVKHLKRWTIRSLLFTDVLLRGIPWTLLWLEGRRLPSGLNFSADQRIAAIVAFALALAIFAVLFNPASWPLVAALVVLAIWLNRGLYSLFLRKGGIWFAVKGFVLQQFYYLYSLFSLTAGVSIFAWRTFTRRFGAMVRRADAQ
jgi:glycosyltransferase involved in cell wall biosynthesis